MRRFNLALLNNMKKYKVVFDHFGPRTGAPYFTILVDNGNGFKQLVNDSWLKDEAHAKVREIITGEREWICVPVIAKETLWGA
jgi:hypothetical protein